MNVMIISKPAGEYRVSNTLSYRSCSYSTGNTMQTSSNQFTFSQIHIEAARNSTDDFNLFHDKNKWKRIRQNPFNGPIVLGFQLECLIENLIRAYRLQHGEQAIISENQLHFSNYQFTFVNAVRPKENISIDIKKSKLIRGTSPTLSNRISVRSNQGIVLFGYKKESREALFLPKPNFSQLDTLAQLPDRSYLFEKGFFLKRKHMNTGNAKNFLSGSLVEQSDYFDELEDKIHFPEIFPVSLISCALLEKASKENHNFETSPMVYTSHRFSINRNHLTNLKSNDRLHILVKQPQIENIKKGLGKSDLTQYIYECYGLDEQDNILFRAIITLATLQNLLLAFNKKPQHAAYLLQS